jgi:hypothetical protein
MYFTQIDPVYVYSARAPTIALNGRFPVAYVDPAEHLTATNTPAVLAARIGYNGVHSCGRRRTAWTFNYRHLSYFGFDH